MYPTVRYLHISSNKEAVREMKRVGVDHQGIRLMSPKFTHFNLKIYGLTPPQANIIKQEILSLGGEAATSRDVITYKTDFTDIIISGTEKQLRHIVEKLKDQHFGLKEVSKGLEEALNRFSKERVVWRQRDREQVLGERTLLMGVLNVTPDSFSDGGEFCDKQEAVKHALLMVEEGADIIDIGGESTRPGARQIETEEELRRVIPVIKALVKETDLPVSVVTTKARVAEEALKAGAEIVNDISAMRFDPEMVKVISCYKA
ncbi:MAG: dihydropteroate synthase, partial [Thermodesulfobacteriota bacterium]